MVTDNLNFIFKVNRYLCSAVYLCSELSLWDKVIIGASELYYTHILITALKLKFRTAGLREWYNEWKYRWEREMDELPCFHVTLISYLGTSSCYLINSQTIFSVISVLFQTHWFPLRLGLPLVTSPAHSLTLSSPSIHILNTGFRSFWRILNWGSITESWLFTY